MSGEAFLSKRCLRETRFMLQSAYSVPLIPSAIKQPSAASSVVLIMEGSGVAIVKELMWGRRTTENVGAL